MISIENLKIEYKKGKSVFDSLSLHLQPGHIYGLLGENGVGKSTLLKIISGLVFPSSGNIAVLDHNPTLRQPSFLKQIFIIPEEVYTPAVSIRSYLSIFSPYYPSFDDNLFHQCLRDFQVPIDAKLQALSFGQRKKVFISFGLATKTKILLMDEPTNGLDIPSKTQFRKVLASALDADRCFIISTHQVRDLDNLIDSVIILSDKKTALVADIADITEKIAFKNMPVVPADALYHEENLSGYQVMLPNTQQEHTKLDMELLFKASLLAKGQMQQILAQH